MFVSQLFISFDRLLLCNPKVIQAVRALAVTLWTSEKNVTVFKQILLIHSGIFKSVETIYEM